MIAGSGYQRMGAHLWNNKRKLKVGQEWEECAEKSESSQSLLLPVGLVLLAELVAVCLCYYVYWWPRGGALPPEGRGLNYSVALNSTHNRLFGSAFAQSHAWLLERYRLSEKFVVSPNISVKRPGDAKFVFVSAANEQYFAPLRRLLANIKQKFGCNQKVIVYDLGRITQNAEMMDEMGAVCNLEWRTFDFTQMAEDVRDLKLYAWKPFVIAQTLLEYDTLMWCDSSVQFESGNFGVFFDLMQNNSIGHVQRPSFTGHGIKYATNPLMYKYVPFYANKVLPTQDLEMFEANFMIFHRSESTRDIMKWAILCSAQRDCIAPQGSLIHCDTSPERKKHFAVCHRYDQSLFSILVGNQEHERQLDDPQFLSHYHGKHPHQQNVTDFVRIIRGQGLDAVTDFKKTVSCC